ncbi:ankyrin 2,3/unc44, putative [Cordyceps militaris CM01]|uniref:Ankyrin 2,3/unc44, putative n=1 Tax=Cordyceps militaris (strain CM01) TaxID=983644 RepID=G3JMR8_CORMM|nr:ankyrin 2,3/unc44, putative [Cordyceps militaris CM01]EGX90100.1 ankyrin 2,3/unc44, putative [Cordyceps militaris CM01]
MPPNFDTSDSENSDGFVVTDKPNRSNIPALSAEKLRKVREWLEPTAYDISGGEYRKHAFSYLPGTGSWLIASPEYQQWLTSQDHGLLWIKGIPGSGKSVMAAKIVSELTTSEPECPVLYFFFRQIIDANHEPASLLRDWMDQLLGHSPILQQQLYSYVKSDRSLDNMSQDDMWKDLKLAITSLPDRVFCVTDALDEMDQDNDSFLKALAKLGHWRPDKVKVLITSRPVPSVEIPLRSTTCLKIRLQEDEVDNDIARFVKHSLETSKIDRKDWDAIMNAVPGNANGLFLYARLAMDAFLEPAADVQTALAHLPADLNVLYTNLLREHIARSGVDAKIQKLILEAVTHATRPLRLLEIAEMISVVDADRDLKARKEIVKAACGPLLEILADETVSVIHHSFTEYLKGVTRLKDDLGYPLLDSGAAHEQLALNCLRYLQNGSLDSFPAEFVEKPAHGSYSDTKVASWQRYPFLKYATGNWFKHVVAACSKSSDDTILLAEIRQLLENGHLRRVWCCLERKGVAWDVPKAHIAAKLGLTGYIKELIGRGEDTDSLDSRDRTPIWWAAGEGHSETARALIAAGARLDRQDTAEGYTPLHQAARANHFVVADLLLRAGVSPMIRRGLRSSHAWGSHCEPNYGESPLLCACEKGHLETLEVMLRYITDLGNIHWALAWAACSGQSRLASLLLEYPGVNVNSKIHGNTLLYLACGSLDIETINLFLQAGADVTALSVGRDHPLNVDIDYTPEPTGAPTQSCLRGMIQNLRPESITRNSLTMPEIEKVFRNLFAAGLDVNQRDSTGQTLLHRLTNFIELVRLLISAGDARAFDMNRSTPLHFVHSPEAVTELVERGGADVNAVNRDGRTPLHCATSEAVISKLLEFGSDSNILDHNGDSTLHLLLSRGCPASYLERIALVLRSGADPNAKNHSGLTPLRSIKNFNEAREIVDCLVQAGADIDARDKSGRTGLFDVVGQLSHISQERVGTLEYLVEAGASKESGDFQGRKIAHEVIKGVMSQYDVGRIVQWLDVLDSLDLLDLEAIDNAGNSLLHEFCSRVQNTRNRLNVDMHLIRLLTGAGVDISQKNHAGQTPLHILCTRPCTYGGSWFAFDQPISYAIQKCEDIDERDADGNTALHVASVYEQSWSKLLLDAGADPTCRNHDGLTPLHLAARCKQSNVVGMLLRAIHDRLGDTPSEEADVINARVVKSCYNIYEPFDITALFYACQSGRPESVKLLLDAGADPNMGNLFVACAMMEQENRLWTAKEHAPGDPIAALRPLDTTRPPKATLEHRSDVLSPFTSTRLEEILDMLVSAGIKWSLLDPDPYRGQANPFVKSSTLDSGYAQQCLSAFKRKHAKEMVDILEHVKQGDVLQGLRLFDAQMVDSSSSAAESMLQQSGWLQQEGIDVGIFQAIIVRRHYHLVKQMVEAGCRFLRPGIPHLEYLIAHGLASVFDQIVEAETRARLHEGEWHAFGDPSRPGLYFQPKPQQDEKVEEKTRREEVRNNMLEYAVCRALPNMEIVRLLVEKYAVNINGGYREKNTALHIIARGRHWWHGAQALQYLVQLGADVECRNSAGQTPLHLALDKEYSVLGEFGPFHKDVAEALINAGADVNAIDSKGRSCLDLAGYNTELIDLLVNNGAAIRPGSMFVALQADNSAALEKLLQGGADANSRMPYVEDHLRETDSMNDCYSGDSRMTFDAALIPRHEIVPLYYIASKSAFPEDADTRSCFRKLLNHGADIYATFQVQRRGHRFVPAYVGDYNKLLGIAEEAKDTPEERSVLHELVRLGKLSKCIMDAVDMDASCLDPKGCTLLHAICDSWAGPDGVIDMTSDDEDDEDESAEEGIVAFQQLLALGCDIQARDNSGQSVVHHLIYRAWKYPQKLGRLEKFIAEISRIAPDLLSAPNASGNSPLHYSALLATSTRRTERVGGSGADDDTRPAQQELMVDLTRLLLRSGASPTGVNQDGNSVLHFLAPNLDRGDVTALFITLVRDHGLDVNASNAQGETPLMLLANRTSVLLRFFSSRNGLCLADEAAAEGVAALAALGADFRVADARGNSLLHLAATDEARLFKAVMDCGGLDPMEENEAHQTAIDVAATCNNNEILALFEKKV